MDSACSSCFRVFWSHACCFICETQNLLDMLAKSNFIHFSKKSKCQRLRTCYLCDGMVVLVSKASLNGRPFLVALRSLWVFLTGWLFVVARWSTAKQTDGMGDGRSQIVALEILIWSTIWCPGEQTIVGQELQGKNHTFSSFCLELI